MTDDVVNRGVINASWSVTVVTTKGPRASSKTKSYYETPYISADFHQRNRGVTFYTAIALGIMPINDKGIRVEPFISI